MPYDADSILALIAILLFVLGAAYLTTRLLSQKTRSLTRCKYMKVRDRMFVGRDKHILLLEVSNKVFIVGITPQGMNVLGCLDGEELTPVSEDEQAAAFPGFKEAFTKFKAFVKNAYSSPERLRRMREEAKRGGADAGEKAKQTAEPSKTDNGASARDAAETTAKSAPTGARSGAAAVRQAKEANDRDDLDKLFEAINKSKSRFSSRRKGGDEA